ncbi:uncharacterized protein LOC110895005 [Helianthus annuus]|uniref:uncharacterized protein LOC110895005 n=1 Tax=Helianthus annuus TaxID=4232 RepID=UPI000B8FB329|nr:uncharacterized protein LOC110895005 [Helianthus annuus]
MELNKIPTAEALMFHNIAINDPSCPLCSSEAESADHLFIACYIASTVWNGVSLWCKIPQIFAFSLQYLLNIYSGLDVLEKKKEAVQGIIIVSCWSLWRARNKLKFLNVPFKIEAILSKIKALSFLWFSKRSKYKGIVWKDWYSFVNM